jgi:Mg-chelatase subunit ChlD
MRGDARCALARSLLRCSAPPRRREASNHSVAALFLCVAFVLPIVSARDATAAPPHYRVGACLSAKQFPEHLKNETTTHYKKRMKSEIENIANAIKRNLPRGVVMDVVPIILPNPEILPGPGACKSTNEDKRKYDFWLILTYDKTSFLYEVRQPDGLVLETNPDPLPDAAQTRELLAEAGARIVGKSVQVTAAPVQVTENASRGIIFLYDSSGSMQETDHGARNRLGVGQSIGEIVAQQAQIPFAVVVFADDAEALERKPGSNWFDTTTADLQVAQTRLTTAFRDIGNTNIGAAFKQVGRLISSRKDIERWHVVFLTDGEPTAGITDYGEIKKLVRAALGGKSTLSVIALHGNDPLHTQSAKLEELAHAIMDASGHSGVFIPVRIGDDPKAVRSRIDDIAFLIIQSTVRDETTLLCTHASGAPKVECELDQSQPHALRFGAAQKVTFIVDTTVLPGGKCTATIKNEGLGTEPRTVELPEGQKTATLSAPDFMITLSRTRDRAFLTIEKLAKGRLNGDWQIKLTAEAAVGGTP